MRRLRVSAGSILTVFGKVVVSGADFAQKRDFGGKMPQRGEYDVRCQIYAPPDFSV